MSSLFNQENLYTLQVQRLINEYDLAKILKYLASYSKTATQPPLHTIFILIMSPFLIWTLFFR